MAENINVLEINQKAQQAEEQAAMIKELFKDQADTIAQVRTDVNRVAFESYKYRTNEIKSIFKKRQEAVKNVPRFWFISMLNCPDLTPIISTEDHEVLNQLQDVWINYDEKDPRNMDITFTFAPNDFFEETQLTKKIRVAEEVTDSSPSYVKYDLDAPVKGDAVKITWKSDEKNLLKKAPLINLEEVEDHDDIDGLGSFFHFFAGDHNPSEVAETLNDWWQAAIEWFSNFMGDDDDDEDDESDDGDLNEEIDLEQGSDEERPSKKQKAAEK